jgi:hypothetical protein
MLIAALWSALAAWPQAVQTKVAWFLRLPASTLPHSAHSRLGSRLLLRDRPELRRFAQKGLWSPSYFAASCGGAPIEVGDMNRILSLPALKDGASRRLG